MEELPDIDLMRRDRHSIQDELALNSEDSLRKHFRGTLAFAINTQHANNPEVVKNMQKNAEKMIRPLRSILGRPRHEVDAYHPELHALAEEKLEAVMAVMDQKNHLDGAQARYDRWGRYIEALMQLDPDKPTPGQQPSHRTEAIGGAADPGGASGGSVAGPQGDQLAYGGDVATQPKEEDIKPDPDVKEEDIKPDPSTGSDL